MGKEEKKTAEQLIGDYADRQISVAGKTYIVLDGTEWFDMDEDGDWYDSYSIEVGAEVKRMSTGEPYFDCDRVVWRGSRDNLELMDVQKSKYKWLIHKEELWAS